MSALTVMTTERGVDRQGAADWVQFTRSTSRRLGARSPTESEHD